ncbi:MAG TPA: OmpH family outer membrane protein [Longimicrobiales bacterium]|nr:OmpH family outer membrane protein [Longimicrobiales bacterium]
MRRTPFAALALTFALVAGTAEAQTLKIGYINSQEILASAPGAREAQAAFESDMQGFNAEAQQLQDELQRMQQQLQQQELTLSPEAKRNRQQQISQKAQEAQDKMAELDQRAAGRRAELVQPIMDKITAVIETMREEGNYALILDVAAGSIISADPSLDLTQEVLRRLQAAPPAPGGDR